MERKGGFLIFYIQWVLYCFLLVLAFDASNYMVPISCMWGVLAVLLPIYHDHCVIDEYMPALFRYMCWSTLIAGMVCATYGGWLVGIPMYAHIAYNFWTLEGGVTYGYD